MIHSKMLYKISSKVLYIYESLFVENFGIKNPFITEKVLKFVNMLRLRGLA